MATVPFVGPFPPPVHGQAVATATIATLLQRRGIRLRLLDTGEAGAQGRWSRRAKRATGLLRAAVHCISSRAPTAYLSVSANAGMIATTVLAGLARLSGKRPILHHHTYAHVVSRTRNMAWLARLAGPSAVHVTICPAMSGDLAATYPEIKSTASFSNVDAVDPELLTIDRPRTMPRTLGFMSNLTLEKGVVRAIEAYRLARINGLADSLVLAGPCSDDGATSAIAAARAEFGDSFRYLGTVSGPTKVAFFADIDVFLFPSLYRNETQGIVNLEALAAGVPVVAYGLCCIPGDLTDPSCCVVALEAAFDTAVTRHLLNLATRFPDASSGARARFRALQDAHGTEVDALAALLTPSSLTPAHQPWTASSTP